MTTASIDSNRIHIFNDIAEKCFFHLYCDGNLVYTTSNTIIDLGAVLPKGEHRVGVCLFCRSGRQDRVMFDTPVKVV